MKTCLNCEKEVDSKTKVPCPHCNSSKGFATSVVMNESLIVVTDTVDWVQEGHRDIEVPVRHEKRNRVYLIILIISVTLSGSFPYKDEWVTPFVMMAVFILGSVGFFWPDIMLHRRKVKITPKKGMEFVD